MRQDVHQPLDVERGIRLVRAREAANLTQLEVAHRLRVARGTMRRWERGHYLPAAKLRQLCEIYHVSEADIRGPLALVRDETPTWPQWAREAWALLQVELVRAGCSEEDVTFLRSFVLADALLARHLPEPQMRLDLEAGIAAARAWVAARYPVQAGQ